MNRIMIVEDDEVLNQGISLALKDEKYICLNAYTIKEAEQLFQQYDLNLIILDIHLPDGNGLNLCKQIRTKSTIPIIFLTGNKEETDIITGFYAGADDYITKPFSLMVLRARVMAALKRGGLEQQNVYYSKNHRLVFDFERMLYHKDHQEIILSRTEQRLLKKLVSNTGIILSRKQLIDYIWAEGAEYVDETALTVTISRLRNKLEDNSNKPCVLKTVYGLGYVWCDEYE